MSWSRQKSININLQLAVSIRISGIIVNTRLRMELRAFNCQGLSLGSWYRSGLIQPRTKWWFLNSQLVMRSPVLWLHLRDNLPWRESFTFDQHQVTAITFDCHQANFITYNISRSTEPCPEWWLSRYIAISSSHEAAFRWSTDLATVPTMKVYSDFAFIFTMGLLKWWYFQLYKNAPKLLVSSYEQRQLLLHKQ